MFEELRAGGKDLFQNRAQRNFSGKSADEIMAAIAKLEACEDREKFP